jgi:hypothetical protein
VVAVEGIVACTSDADEVVAGRADLETAQPAVARRKRVQIVVEGIVVEALQRPAVVEQADEGVRRFER